MTDPLIVTLALDPATQDWLEGMRRAYFPPERNLVPAHVTLFHALPGAETAAIRAALAAECADMAAVPVTLGPPRLLGRGVALAVAAPAIASLRKKLAARWQDRLTAQDRQGWRPHATVQNKVTAEQARALYDTLATTVAARRAWATGLLLWHYRGGPWEPAGRFGFAPVASAGC